MIRIIREEYERRRWEIWEVQGSGGKSREIPLRQPSKVSGASEVLRARTSLGEARSEFVGLLGSFTGGSPGGRVTTSTVMPD